MNKLITIVILSFILYGCAPHYYDFRLLNSTTEGNIFEEKVVVDNKDFVNIHYPGNQIEITTVLNISNKSEEMLLFSENNFKISSQIYNYKFNYIEEEAESIDSEKTEVNNFIEVPPYSSKMVMVKFGLDKKIKEREFISERLKDTIVMSINVYEEVIMYTYKPI